MTNRNEGPIYAKKNRDGGSPTITRVLIPTSGGNEILVFYNPDNNLICVDLIAYDAQGGNEILRQYIDESELLGHL